jgi:hypothetical protein
MFFWTDKEGRDLLTYTSFLFGVTSWMAMTLNHWMGPAFLVQMALSIVHHGKWYDSYFGKNVIKWTDKSLAQYISVRSVYDAYYCQWCPAMKVYWGCISWVVFLHCIVKWNRPHHLKGNLWHSTLHITSNMGCISMLYAIKNE